MYITRYKKRTSSINCSFAPREKQPVSGFYAFDLPKGNAVFYALGYKQKDAFEMLKDVTRKSERQAWFHLRNAIQKEAPPSKELKLIAATLANKYMLEDEGIEYGEAHQKLFRSMEEKEEKFIRDFIERCEKEKYSPDELLAAFSVLIKTKIAIFQENESGKLENVVMDDSNEENWDAIYLYRKAGVYQLLLPKTAPRDLLLEAQI